MKLCVMSVGALILSLTLAARQREDVASKLAGEFTVIDPQIHLYAVDKRYVLQAIPCRMDELSTVRVVPEYFFSDRYPEWTEPDSAVFMSLSSYQDLLKRIEDVQPLGALIREGEIGITLNLRTSFWDQYKGGIVERAMYRESPADPNGVAWFTVTYFHLISGKLESKKPPAFPFDNRYSIKIDGKWYLTTRSVFQNTKVGITISVMTGGCP